MTDLTRLRMQTPYPFDPVYGPGWTDLYVREGTDDMTIVEESWVQDVYRVRGLNLRSFGVIDGARVGGVVIDLGANIGAFSTLCLRYGASRVIAVEPEPGNLAMLERNLASWGRAGNAQIVRAAAAAGDRGVRLVGETGTAHVDYTNGTVVASITLTDLMSGIDRVALLKVDIEGAEYDTILSTPHDVLALIDRIHMEWHGPGEAPWLERTRLGELVEHLSQTHAVELFGRPDVGGMLYAHAYDL